MEMVLNEIYGNKAYPKNRHDKYTRTSDCIKKR